MNRRGTVHEMVVAIVIIMVGFFIVWMWLVKAGVIASEDSKFQMCKLTVSAQQATKVGADGALGQFDSPLSLNCERRVLKIEESNVKLVREKAPDHVVPTYPTGKAQVRYSKLNDTIVASVFAESMKRCWAMTLEGKQPIFNPREVGFFGLSEPPTTCLICDEIHVNTRSDGSTYLRPGGEMLSSYLAKTKIPNEPRDITYADYLFIPTDHPGRNIIMKLFLDNPLLDNPWYDIGLTDDEELTLSNQALCLYENSIELNPQVHPGSSYATIFFRKFSRTNEGCMAVYTVPAGAIGGVCDYVAN